MKINLTITINSKRAELVTKKEVTIPNVPSEDLTKLDWLGMPIPKKEKLPYTEKISFWRWLFG
jgi:hypothetical protein